MQLYVGGGGHGSLRAHQARCRIPAPAAALAEDDGVAAVGEDQLEVAAVQPGAGSTSGPRPATPRAPPRPRPRRARGGTPSSPAPTSTAARAGRGAAARSAPLGSPQAPEERRQDRPPLRHAGGGVDREHLEQRLGPLGGADLAHRLAEPAAALLRAADRELQLVADRAGRGRSPAAAARVAGRRQRLQPRRQHRAQRAGRGARPAQPLLDAPAAAVAEQGAEAQASTVRPCAAARRGSGRRAARGRARAGCPAVPSAAPPRSASSSCGRRGPQRLLLAAGEPQRLAAPSGPKRSATWSAESAASAPSVSTPSRSIVSARSSASRSPRPEAAGQRRDRQRREEVVQVACRGRSPPAARRRRRRRSGSARPRSATGTDPPRRAAASTTPSDRPPWIPSSPSTAKKASPGRSDSTAAPIPSSRSQLLLPDVLGRDPSLFGDRREDGFRAQSHRLSPYEHMFVYEKDRSKLSRATGSSKRSSPPARAGPGSQRRCAG